MVIFNDFVKCPILLLHFLWNDAGKSTVNLQNHISKLTDIPTILHARSRRKENDILFYDFKNVNKTKLPTTGFFFQIRRKTYETNNYFTNIGYFLPCECMNVYIA